MSSRLFGMGSHRTVRASGEVLVVCSPITLAALCGLAWSFWTGGLGIERRALELAACTVGLVVWVRWFWWCRLARRGDDLVYFGFWRSWRVRVSEVVWVRPASVTWAAGGQGGVWAPTMLLRSGKVIKCTPLAFYRRRACETKCLWILPEKTLVRDSGPAGAHAGRPVRALDATGPSARPPRCDGLGNGGEPHAFASAHEVEQFVQGADAGYLGKQECIDALCTFLRAPWPGDSARSSNGEWLVRARVVELIGERFRGQDPESPRSWCACVVDLSGALLPPAQWSGCSFFGGLNLEGARFLAPGVDLSDAEVQFARFARADLSGARLGGAFIPRGDLRGANLEGADLSDAEMPGCLFA